MNHLYWNDFTDWNEVKSFQLTGSFATGSKKLFFSYKKLTVILHNDMKNGIEKYFYILFAFPINGQD